MIDDFKEIYNKHRGAGKASALNMGLKYAKGELFAVIDADSEIEKNSLKNLISYFEDNKTGSVISSIKIRNPKSFMKRSAGGRLRALGCGFIPRETDTRSMPKTSKNIFRWFLCKGS